MDRRLVKETRLTVCPNGHVVSRTPTGRERWQFRCPHCQKWTWEDGNFCVQCGAKLRERGPQPDPTDPTQTPNSAAVTETEPTFRAFSKPIA